MDTAEILGECLDATDAESRGRSLILQIVSVQYRSWIRECRGLALAFGEALWQRFPQSLFPDILRLLLCILVSLPVTHRIYFQQTAQCRH